MLRTNRKSSPVLVRSLACGAAFLSAASATAPALASKPLTVVREEWEVPPPPPDPPPPPEPPRSSDQTGGGILFYGFGSFAAIDGLGVSPTGDSVEPDPLKNKHLRLAGGGHLGGGGFQIDIFGKYVRGGVGVSVFGIEGTRLDHDRLANGFSVAPSSGWGAGFDIFVGHEFLKGPVRPYVDLVGSINVLSLEVDLVHPTYGRLGRTQYEGWLFGFGPRAGLSIPLSDSAFFDVAGTYSITGSERFRVTAGFGFWGR